jgi:hypothetical protein
MRKKAKGYSLKTGTDPLRKHLYEDHPNSWISGCDRLCIPITAKAAQRAVAEYRNRQGQHTNQQSSNLKVNRTFSREAFVDAIIEFIVVDDQVSNLFFNVTLSHARFSSQLT